MTIIRYGNRFDVVVEGGSKMHVLNAVSLKWNLQHVFKLSKKETTLVLKTLETDQYVILERVAV